MWLLIRTAALVGLWLAAQKLPSGTKEAAKQASEMSWPQKARLVSALGRDKRVPAWTRALLMLPVIYVASPIDLLPDVIPVLGRLDDALIFSLAFGLAARFAPATVLSEHVEAALKGR